MRASARSVRTRAVVGLLGCALLVACGTRLRRAIRMTEAVDAARVRSSLVPLEALDVDAWLRSVDARIIALGEPNHGSRAPRRLHVELVLAASERFPRLVIFGEWCDAEGRELDAYVQGSGADGAPPRIAGPVVWSSTWDEAWKRLRADGASSVRIFGMRACRPADHERELRELLRGLSAAARAAVEAELARQVTGAEALEQQAEVVREILAALGVPPPQACELHHQLRLLAQARLHREDPLFQGDRAMAENVSRVLRCHEPEARALILAHDGHVAKTERMLLPNGRRQEVVFLGTALAAEFSDDYYAVATLAGDGRFCAVPRLRPRARETRAYRLAHPRGSLEWHLSREPSLPPAWFLDLRAVPPGTFPATAFMAGHGYWWGWPLSWVRALAYHETDLQHDFDAVIHWRRTEPDALPGCD